MQLLNEIKKESIQHIKFPPAYKISDWADNNRFLSREASAEPGRWDTSRAEYQRGIMDAICDDSIERVVVMSSAQIGKTEIELNIIGYYIDQDPSPILVVYPTETMAKAFSEDRLSTMLRDTPCLQNKVKDPRSRESKNTKLHKMFPGGHITMVGANSPSNLASRPIRVVLFDEVDRFPVSSGGSEGEGDVITLASKRTVTFFNRKLIEVSTPTIKDASRIELSYESSDKRKYFVPCHSCGEYQALSWKNVHWDKEGDEHKPETAVYCCEKCGVIWSEKDRHVSVKKGEWRATGKYTGIAGFHINELYSPWSSLQRMVESFLEAKKSPELLKAWVNTSLGETWEEAGDIADSFALMSRREDFDSDSVPLGVGAVVAGVDVQDDRIESLLLGFGKDNEVWALEHSVFYGDLNQNDIWENLKNHLTKRLTNVKFNTIGIRCACIDSGGHYTKRVYEFVKPLQGLGIFAIKGNAEQSHRKEFVGRPTSGNIAKVKLFPVYSDIGKDVLFARLKVDKPGPAFIHFGKKFDDEFFAQLGAEKRVIKYHKGFPRREYQKTRARNEAIDLFVYAFAAWEISGIKNIVNLVNSYSEQKQEDIVQEPVDTEREVKERNKLLVQRRHNKKNWINGWKT